MSNLLKGRLIQWNSKKGFGFIEPVIGSENIFIHISDFNDKNYHPIIGEIIIYQIGKGKGNKKKAIYAYPERKKVNHIGNIDKKGQKNHIRRRTFYKRYIYIGLFGILAMSSVLLQRYNPKKNNIPSTVNYEYEINKDTESVEEFLEKEKKFIAEHTAWSKNHFNSNDENSSEEFIQQLKYNRTKKIKNNLPEKKIYHCNGRKYCSQMRSCEEAKYFLNHCPNTKMDGDGDGIPCEGQWCGH